MDQILPSLFENIVHQFHRVYYHLPTAGGRNTWFTTWWMGVPVLKCPFDLWTYQEMISELRPDLIIETGTHKGGSALYMAHLLDAVGSGEVVTIDIENYPDRPAHKRILYLTGSSIAPEIFAQVKQLAAGKRCVMVILDSDHSERHVLEELKLYTPLVTVGSYAIVEDTNVHGHPVYPLHEPGPMEAVQRFMPTTDSFIIDADRQRFLLTFNPDGYLKRVK